MRRGKNAVYCGFLDFIGNATIEGSTTVAQDAIIEVQDLKKTYSSGFMGRRKTDALKGVTFRVGKGEVFGLLGPNGAGKTTMVKVLLGLVRKTGGDASILGQAAGAINARRRVGYLPEHHLIPRHHSVDSALEYYGSLSGMPMAEIREKRQPMLELVGLANQGKTKVGNLSKGMKQRLGLAQAMLHDPELLILDEPTDGVDPVGREQIRVVLHKKAEEGTTIFVNSHLLHEVEKLCSHVVVLDRGRVLQAGAVDDLTRVGGSEQVTLILDGAKPDIMGAAGHEHKMKLKDAPAGRAQLNIELPDQTAVDGLIDRLREKEVSIISMSRAKKSLEEAFLSMVEEEQQ